MKKLTVDPELVRRLADLMDEKGLAEIEVQEQHSRLRLAKPMQQAAPMAAMPPAPAAVSVEAPPTEGEKPPENIHDHPGLVTAPMVGTAYLQAEPGAPPFISENATIAEGETLLIIEAMKVMNQIKAPRSGTVTRILVQDGQPVEYGEPMLIIE